MLVTSKPRKPLSEAQALFEAGSVSDAAKLLHSAREMARARGALVWLARSDDDVVAEMRAHLTRTEQEMFDHLLETGELPAGAPRRQDSARRPLVIGLTVWFVFLPIWLFVLFVVTAAGGGFTPPSNGWRGYTIALVLFGVPWLILGARIVQWWRRGREGLWRPPLAWLLLLVPYFWPALLVPRVRRWWSRLATARPQPGVISPAPSPISRHRRVPLRMILALGAILAVGATLAIVLRGSAGRNVSLPYTEHFSGSCSHWSRQDDDLLKAGCTGGEYQVLIRGARNVQFFTVPISTDRLSGPP